MPAAKALSPSPRGRDINAAFTKHYEQEHGRPVEVKQSHAASGSQARAVIDGLDADVVTLALAGDIDQIANKTDKLPKDKTTLLIFYCDGVECILSHKSAFRAEKLGVVKLTRL